MNRIGIITATKEEFEEILNLTDETTERKIFNIKFVEGKIHKKNIVIVKCGVGKVNAARVTQMLIDNYDIECIINIGAAGSLNSLLDIGDIVIAEKLVQHDFDITAFGHDKGYISDVGQYFYCDNKLVDNIQKTINKISNNEYKIKKGIIASGDIFCTDIKMKENILSDFNAECIEMEGASIAQVCYLSDIPFIVIRCISDSPNGKNTIEYEKFAVLASKRCAKILKTFFIV